MSPLSPAASSTSTPSTSINPANQVRSIIRKKSSPGRPVLRAAFPQFSRTQLAEQCGVDVAHICKVLNGAAGTSVDLAQRMSKVMGVRLDSLLEELQRARSAFKAIKALQVKAVQSKAAQAKSSNKLKVKSKSKYKSKSKG